MGFWQKLLNFFGIGRQHGSSSSNPVPPPAPGPNPPPAAPSPGNELALTIDPNRWFQEYVALGGNTIPATRPIGGSSMVEAIPDRSSNRFISYLLFPIQPKFSTTSADPTPHYVDIREYKSLTVRFRIKASKGIKWSYDSEPGNTPDRCPTPAHARPFLSHSQLNLQDWAWRWFAHHLENGKEDAAYPLADGDQEVTLTVPLTQDHWVSVYPGRDPAREKQGWLTMLADTSYFGLVFGGGCAYAHGVSVTGGTATVELLEYRLTK